MAKINFYLDCRKIRKDGLSPVTLVLSHKGKRHVFFTGVYLTPADWNAEICEAVKRHPLFKQINLTLKQYRLDCERILLEVGKSATISEIAARIKCDVFFTPDMKPEASAPAVPLLADALRRFASLKTEANTRATYEQTLRHVERFRPDATLDEVRVAWLTEFDNHMAATSPSPNARAIHMRNLRAVFNFAIDEGLTSNYPFRRFKIKTVRTAKRNLPAADLRRLLTMDVEEWQRPYRDFFAISFFLIGTNAKDILHLPHDALRSGRVVFNRAKTKKLYDIRVEPELAALLERYRGADHLLCFMDGRTDYLQFIRQCNHALGLLGTEGRPGRKREGTPLWPGLTTYWARHSWATAAATLDIPKETIAAALGHGGSSVTDIYIDFARPKVDEANRRVIDYVFGKIKC